jgi:hypothetical protein
MEIDRNAPATKGGVQDIVQEAVQDLEVRIDARFHQFEHRMEQLVHDSETRIFQAFYGYAEATNKRFNQVDGNVAIFLNRLGTVESRLLEVEKRLNIPPSA